MIVLLHLSRFVLQSLMTEETERLIKSLQEKTSLLKNELLSLKHENSVLHEELEAKQLAMDESKVKLGELEHRYSTLKIAKALGSNADNDSLKKQVNAMVREIETCIELIDK
jgi:hypothetical protein